ncbi:hypothetical protein B0A68_01570 [Flavobacterium reichenbachii]|uniref:Uncharacterized protein n=1 Tax=Flavobacterium reichenbachii TaxID=362418 RepID=A0A085ZQF3_9FLAO|nr:hypothetical protein IW19_14630 [Flavobacterium reichenbachii]OXB18729.1 hypothetical protein B0A68_01570 [Flavobacterium reichenbachii]
MLRSYKIILSTVLLLLFISCNKKQEIESDIYGNLYLSSFYMNKHYLTDDSSFEINFERNSGWLTLNDLTKNLMYSAKFEFVNEKKDSIKISKSKFNGLNGLYSIHIDTLSTSEQSDAISITFKSKTVYLKGYKSIVKSLASLK